MRLIVLFAVCLAVLGIGRVKLSIAVTEKTLQTDKIVREERRLTAENARLDENLAQLGSSLRIQRIASHQLGLQYPTHLQYLKVREGIELAKLAARP